MRRPLEPGLSVAAESTEGDGTAALVGHLQHRMRAAEQTLAIRMSDDVAPVVADGRVHGLDTGAVVGYTKTHHVRYLPEEHEATVRLLAVGERTPLFLIGDDHFARYAWYLRLAQVAGGHAWSGIVRCEIATGVGVSTAAEAADWTTCLLPDVASEPHTDPRAPQNLVPVAALERQLRRLMGDRDLVNRAVRSAVLRESVALAARRS